jgi:vacuolar-type H+-ATPase subunit I/STV1
MSQYVDKEYYQNTFKGNKISEEEIDSYLLKASEKIDELTFNRIVAIGFDKLTDFQKEKIQRAICLHADYIFEFGTEMGQISSFSVLDINVSIDNKNSIEAKFGTNKEIYNLVKQTGLTCGVI